MKRGKSDLNNDETNSLVARMIAIFAISTTAVADGWRVVYSESFDQIATGSATASASLPNWEGGSAAGKVFDGGSESEW